MKKNSIFILVAITVFGFRLWQQTGCTRFQDFRFHPISIKISAEEGVNIDNFKNKNISRIFHNKLTVGIFELSKSYSALFNPIFLIESLSPLGFVLLLISLSKLKREKSKFYKLHAATVFTVPALSLIFKPPFGFYMPFLSFSTFSFWSINYFKKDQKLILLFFLIAAVSIWYFFLTWRMPAICNEIHFN